jgi:hypothetical protein
MPWQSSSEARFVEPLIDNLIAVVKRDGEAALAWANGGAALPKFAMHQRARRPNPLYPWLGVHAVRSQPGEDEEHYEERHEVVLEIALKGNDPDALTDQIFKYVRAVHAVVVSASADDLTAGYPDAALRRWSVEAHDYDLTREHEIERGTFLQRATLSCVFELIEIM